MLRKIRSAFRSLRSDRGATAVEYALIVGLVAAVAVATWLDATTVAAPQGGPVVRPAVSAGGYIYISTIRPTSTDGDIAAQTRDVFGQLKATLEANQSSMGQLCHIQVSLRKADDFAAMNTAYAELIGDAPPADRPIVIERVVK